MQHYISSELTHFAGRGKPREEQYKTLHAIISTGLLSHSPQDRGLGGNLNVNFNAEFSSNKMYNPELVCFCDIPVEEFHLHMNKFSHFGLAFEKKFIISKRGRPVMYIPESSVVLGNAELSPEILARSEAEEDPLLKGKLLFEEREIAGYFDEMIREYLDLLRLPVKLISATSSNLSVSEQSKRFFALRKFLDFHIFSFIKLFDPALEDDDLKNFYFEREWRVIGNVDFKLTNIVRVILPQEFAEKFRKDFPDYSAEISFSE